MSLQLKILCSGPMGNNVVILFDEATRCSIIIDPSFDPEDVLTFVNENSLTVEMILFTHGHFDHFAGLSFLLANLVPIPKVGLHEDDLALWRMGGGSVQFRIPIELPADPNVYLAGDQTIELGNDLITVSHTPGHSPGSVTFYIESLNTAVVGDLIFFQGIGRTDLDGGSFEELKNSIETHVFSLPAETTLIPGHGPLTSVESEMRLNPYVGLTSHFL